MQSIRTALVIGAGTMGHGFAQIFAMKGVNVLLVDRTEELLARARTWIIDNLTYMAQLGEIGKEEIEPSVARISFTTDLRKAAGEADFILEAVYEDLDLKRRIFTHLDKYTQPSVPLATNTSSFDINELAAVATHPERVIGTHWFHPPQITPAVEVIPAAATNRETIDCAIEFMKRVGKAPTLCKSTPGFVANRIQFAMAAEAFRIVEEGLATPQEVDRIVKSSFGFRLGAYGPCEICDQAGADTYYAVYEYLYRTLKKEHFAPSSILKKLVEEGRLGLKSQGGFYEYKEGADEALKRQRDRKLYSRLRLFREETETGEGG